MLKTITNDIYLVNMLIKKRGNIMKLREYLHSNRIKINGFAELANITPVTLQRIMRGCDCKISIAHRIVEASKGNVRFIDLIPIKKAD